MAYIEADEEELGQGQEGQGPQVGQGSNLVSSGQGGGASGQGGGPGSGWTNIQAYLNANKGDTGSAQALSSTVNSQFGQEREKMTGDANKFLGDANKQVADNSVTTDQAQGLIDDSAKNYNYGGTQGDPYQKNLGKVQGFLNSEYSGPKEYNYGFSAQTQNYGNALKDGSGFDSIMNDVYANAAKQPLTSGQYQLQKQFDVNSDALAQAKTSLAGSYDQLGQERDKLVTDTTGQLGATEQAYRENQNKLRDFLGVKRNDYGQAVDKAEADARAGYKNTFEKDQSGLRSHAESWINDLDSGHRDRHAGKYQNAGIWGDLTWDQLQKEQERVKFNPNRMSEYGLDYYGGVANVLRPEIDRRKSVLNDFYSGQDAKYANTGDEDERRYNAILDFLGSSDKKREQGFKVRG